ncbi:MAG: hypothetical protein FRX49_02710 [Trebouxia sp. A1-2]|nr:MAG: hypothetical protein FRX49_02710 [Trebouxia sp. A1-2]
MLNWLKVASHLMMALHQLLEMAQGFYQVPKKIKGAMEEGVQPSAASWAFDCHCHEPKAFCQTWSFRLSGVPQNAACLLSSVKLPSLTIFVQSVKAVRGHLWRMMSRYSWFWLRQDSLQQCDHVGSHTLDCLRGPAMPSNALRELWRELVIGFDWLGFCTDFNLRVVTVREQTQTLCNMYLKSEEHLQLHEKEIVLQASHAEVVHTTSVVGGLPAESSSFGQPPLQLQPPRDDQATRKGHGAHGNAS